MVTETKLTKEHVRFIRKASKSVVFRYTNGRAKVEFEDKHGIELDIEVEQRENLYGKNHGKMYTGFAMIHTPDFTAHWCTIAQLLKVGDVLGLRWVADANGYVRNAHYSGDSEMEAFDSLHMDSCYLTVKRGKSLLEFHVATSICPDNSARMIKVAA